VGIVKLFEELRANLLFVRISPVEWLCLYCCSFFSRWTAMLLLCFRCRAWVRKAAEAGKLDTILTWHAPPDFEESTNEGLESLVEGHSGEGRHATDHGKEAARTGDKVGHS
jgi:hypothetical protein